MHYNYSGGKISSFPFCTFSLYVIYFRNNYSCYSSSIFLNSICDKESSTFSCVLPYFWTAYMQQRVFNLFLCSSIFLNSICDKDSSTCSCVLLYFWTAYVTKGLQLVLVFFHIFEHHMWQRVFNLFLCSSIFLNSIHVCDQEFSTCSCVLPYFWTAYATKSLQLVLVFFHIF